MSKQFVRSLQLAPKRSIYGISFIVVVHSLAGIASWANALPIWVRILSFSLVVISLIASLKQQAFTSPKNRIRIFFSESSEWQLQIGNGSIMAAQLLGSSVVTNLVTILHFKTENKKRHSIILFRDSLDSESFRLLRVVLRTMKHVPREGVSR